MNQSMKNRAGHGFTMVELLSALAVIAVLATLVLNAMTGVQASARSKICLSNQRQIGAALILYANEHNGGLPPTTHLTGRTRIEESWIYGIAPYLNDVEEIRVCPAEPPERAKQILVRKATSYLVNDLVLDDPEYNRLPSIPFPSRTRILFTLSDSRVISGTRDHVHGAEWTSWAAALDDVEPDRHRPGSRAADRLTGSANYLFADGHVESLPASGFKALFERGINPAKVPTDPTE